MTYSTTTIHSRLETRLRALLIIISKIAHDERSAAALKVIVELILEWGYRLSFALSLTCPPLNTLLHPVIISNGPLAVAILRQYEFRCTAGRLLARFGHRSPQKASR